jgi:hypothetical protein
MFEKSEVHSSEVWKTWGSRKWGLMRVRFEKSEVWKEWGLKNVRFTQVGFEKREVRLSEVWKRWGLLKWGLQKLRFTNVGFEKHQVHASEVWKVRGLKNARFTQLRFNKNRLSRMVALMQSEVHSCWAWNKVRLTHVGSDTNWVSRILGLKQSEVHSSCTGTMRARFSDSPFQEGSPFVARWPKQTPKKMNVASESRTWNTGGLRCKNRLEMKQPFAYSSQRGNTTHPASMSIVPVKNNTND